MSDRLPLNPRRFDAIAPGPEKIWGLATIASALNVSESTARRWAESEEVPIYKPCGIGKYFAVRSELNAWLRGRA